MTASCWRIVLPLVLAVCVGAFAVFVAETTPLLRLIPLMQQQRSQCVVVVDEHGAASGLAFLEDALEHVVLVGRATEGLKHLMWQCVGTAMLTQSTFPKSSW